MFSACPGKSGKIKEEKRNQCYWSPVTPKVPFYSLPLYLSIINQSHSQSRYVTCGLRFPADSVYPHTRQKIGKSAKYQGITTTGTLQAIPPCSRGWARHFFDVRLSWVTSLFRERRGSWGCAQIFKQTNTKLKYLWLLWKLAQWSSRAGSRKVLQTNTEMSWEEILLTRSEGPQPVNPI